MAWLALALGVSLVVVVLSFGFDRSRLARRVGELEAKDETNDGKIKWLHAALESRSAAEPTLDDLDGMFEDPPDTAA